LLNLHDTEALFYSLRRIFYCYIKSSRAQDREDFDANDRAFQPEIELSSISINPQEKIRQEDLRNIHEKRNAGSHK